MDLGLSSFRMVWSVSDPDSVSHPKLEFGDLHCKQVAQVILTRQDCVSWRLERVVGIELQLGWKF